MTSLFGRLEGVQISIANKFMRETIKHHIKREYYKKGIVPTTQQVMQDIPAQKMLVFLNNGFTREGIEGMVEDIIGRRK